LFTFPVSFEIWNIYLSKFVKRYVRPCHLRWFIRVNET
jgi:hypothetical protein